jgi:hypothetical protein
MVCLTPLLDNNDVGNGFAMLLEELQMIFGYLDPGSGSLLLQVVIGGAAGIAVAAKALRQKYQLRRGKGVAVPDEGEATESIDDTPLPTDS